MATKSPPRLLSAIPYLGDCRCKLHKATTLTHDGNGLKRFQIWYTTRVPDGEITQRNAKDFNYWLANIKQRFDDHPGRPTEEDHLSPATVRRTVGVVRTFFTWLYDEGIYRATLRIGSLSRPSASCRRG